MILQKMNISSVINRYFKLWLLQNLNMKSTHNNPVPIFAIRKVNNNY